MSDTSGPTSYAPFAKWDRDSQSWKTSEATSLWALTLSSLTLPQWGGLHDGELSEHPTPERLTSGLDCSSLPTPSANDTTGAEDQAQRKNRGAGGPMLRDLPTMLPTPSAADGMGGHASRSGDWSDELLLPGLVKTFLPTPTTQHASGGYNPDWGHGMTLLDAAKEIVQWTGPTTRQPYADGKASLGDLHLTQPSQESLALPA